VQSGDIFWYDAAIQGQENLALGNRPWIVFRVQKGLDGEIALMVPTRTYIKPRHQSLPTNVFIDTPNIRGWVTANQILSVPVETLTNFVGRVSPNVLQEILRAIKFAVGIVNQ
jgi:mRNA-degrading endonuclease toxin of MazEF toxin-antitoxin module